MCHVLFGAVAHLSDLDTDGDMDLPDEISGSTMNYAVNIMLLGIDHKCALMPLPLQDPLQDNRADDEPPAPPTMKTTRTLQRASLERR